MNLQSTINHLEAGLVEELAAQTASLEWICDLEQSLMAYDSAAFEEKAAGGDALCRKAARSATRRQELLAELAQFWGIAPGTLTLGSVVRRLDGAGARLEDLRKELRQTIAEVMKRQRRLATLISMHKRINEDVMQIMVGCDTPDQINQGGTLVNAEA